MAPRLARCSKFLAVVALCGCGKSPEDSRPAEAITAEPPCDTPAHVVPPQVTAKERAEQKAHDASCPMLLPGVTMTSRDLNEGVALYFTTSGEVSELRQRVRELATTHAHDGGHDHDPCSCPLLGSDGVPLMAEASTSAEPTPGGARLLLVPNERSEAVHLRARVAERLKGLRAGSCAGRR